MKPNKKIVFLAFFIFVIFFMNFVSSTYTRSNLNSYTASKVEESSCEDGQDFVIQIAPYGCTPAVVRSDLLEDSDVQVFCQLAATQINPLVDVKAIDSVSFSGTYPQGVSGVGFHPVKGALGVDNQLNNAVLDNIGYVVINLRQQSNASAIPNSISGTLTAKISYDLENAFGIGKALFYIPQLSDEEWEENNYQYSFWNGKGLLKVEEIDEDSAKISVYSGNSLISKVNLKKGETSDSIYIPGFKCSAGLKLTLSNFENPDTKVRLRINSEVINVAKGEKFLDNKCKITDLGKRGLLQETTIKCQEDDETSTFDLVISPTILLTINEQETEVTLGSKLYNKGSDGVYVGYIGAKGNVASNENIFIWLVSRPLELGDEKLSTEELTSITSMIEDMEMTGLYESSGIVQDASEGVKSFGGLLTRMFRFFGRGEKLYKILYKDKSQEFQGNSLTILGFAGAVDSELTEDAKLNYNNAITDYETIRTEYSSEVYSESTFGEEALYNEILLMWDASQKSTVLELCKKFEENYPSSEKNLNSICENYYQLSNSASEKQYVTVNKETKLISFDGIYEPIYDDYGAKVLVKTAGGAKSFYLRKNEINYLDQSGEDYIQLLELDDTTATIRTSISAVGVMAAIKKEFNSDRIKLTKDTTKTLAESYSFTLQEVHLNKLAKVSVVPNIDDSGTQANFSFKIGIEKRAIELSPDKIKSMIAGLDEEIDQWQEISDTLEKSVESLKTGCLIAGAALVVKNFMSNLNGAGIARQTVMSGTGGWKEKCAQLVSQGKYSSTDQCYAENADEIDADVETMSQLIESQNSEIQKLEEGITTKEFLSEEVVDTEQFAEKYSPQVSETLGNLGTSLSDPSGKGESISISEIQKVLSKDYNQSVYSIEQLRNIELYTNILQSDDASDNLKELAKKNLYSELSDVKENADATLKRDDWADTLSVSSSKISSIETQKDTKKLAYYGLTNKDLGSKKISAYSDKTPVALVQTYPDGQSYILILDDSSGTNKLSIKNMNNQLAIYDSSGKLVENPSKELSNIYFEKYDSSSYKNKYTNAKLRYYETDPYKGMPAIVPFDLDNGWYAATKQTLSIGGNIASYEESGRVSSFYVCNVGQNGLEEFQTTGDDVCEMVNTGTGQSYNQFPGLSESDAAKIINKAVEAIEQASKLYKSGLSGKVKILDQVVEVGSPAVDTLEYECQDYMSPKDCLILFNLCDPVICPSSRCDLGGTYPVSNVVQSGIIGSIVLCLPNIKEKIVLPVCLTGIKAGIDSFLSVKQSYRDCLNESLTTGSMIGICDKIYSIYICDFFWSQALPLADMVIPKLLEAITGQGARGGGEYLGVSNAWETAKDSVTYFTQSYGANSFKAFQSRSIEEIGTEFCKSYVSSVYPSSSDLLSSLIESESPVQYTANFEEISLTTVTNPPTSQYKVYYHIYAGENSGAYYQVYLKGSSDSSYYQDTSTKVTVASGYVSVGDYASETRDFTAPSGYTELCVDINGEVECGFQQVTTSFALNYVTDKYLQSQASQTDITKTSECISGSSSAYSLLDLNAQSAASELADPAIYEKGIIRICATDNPGKGSDPYAGMNGSRWQVVGYCDDENIKCWLDTDSVEDVIKSTSVEGDTLSEVATNYVDILKNESGYLSDNDYSSAISNIEEEEDPATRISLIENVLDKVFWSSEKALLIFLRGNAYSELFRNLAPLLKFKSTSTTSTNEIKTLTEKSNGETISTTELSSSGYIIWETAKKLANQGWDESRKADECKASLESGENRKISTCSLDKNCIECMKENVCARFVLRVLVNAGIRNSYIEDNAVITDGTFNGHWSSLESIDNLIKMFKGSSGFSEVTDFSNIQLGDIVILGHHLADETYHIMVFDSYNTAKTSINAYGEPGMDGGPAQLQKGNPIISKESYYVYKVFRSTGELVDETVSEDESVIDTTEYEEEGSEVKLTKISEKINKYAENIISGEEYGLSYKDVQFVSACIENSGAKGFSEVTTLTGLKTELGSNSRFIQINPSAISYFQKGDIVIFGKACALDSTVGIFSYFTGENMMIYGNLNSKSVTSQTVKFTNSFGSGFIVTAVYRYVGDLSSSEYGELDTRDKWTVSTALIKANELVKTKEAIDIASATEDSNSLMSESAVIWYRSYPLFVSEIIRDEILTEKECKTLNGGLFGWGKKDITWIKTTLQSKNSS